MLGGLDLARLKGLEFGPLTSPMVLKSQGNIRYIDHDAAEGLRKKYTEIGSVDVSKIVDVDFIKDGRPLRNVVSGERFDYVIASHVFEHIANPIGWLNDCESVLEQDGVLCLALPDKRYTFDFFRPLTTLAQWIGAFVDGLERPSAATVFENASLCTGHDFSILLRSAAKPEFKHAPDLHGALRLAKEAPSRYIDCHCTVCTPESFADLIKQSADLGLHNFRIEALFATEPGWLEFQVRLKNSRVCQPM